MVNLRTDSAAGDPDVLLRLGRRLRSLPIQEFLALISRASWLKAGARRLELLTGMQRSGWDPQFALRDHQMAFLVDVMLQDHVRSWGRGWKRGGDKEKWRTLYDLTRMVNGVLPQADRDIHNLPLEARGGPVVLRRGNQQFPEQEDSRTWLPRTILIWRQFARAEEERQGVTLDQILQDQLGMALDEWLALALGLYATFHEGRVGQLFARDFFAPSPDFPGLGTNRMVRLIDILSTDYRGHLQAMDDPKLGRVPGYELYNLSPLIQRPILRTENARYVIPVWDYFRRRISTGLFFDVLGHKTLRNQAANIIGHAIELYVERLLTDLPNGSRPIRPSDTGGSQMRCDWIVPGESMTLLIECKRRSITQRSKTTGMREDLRKDIDSSRGIAGGIRQLYETAKAAASGCLLGVSPKSRIIPVLVTLDAFYWANIPYVREIIAEVLNESKEPIDTSGFDYQICPLPDLEDVCRLLATSGQSLAEFFANKIDDAERASWDVSGVVRRAPPEAFLDAAGNPGTIPCHDEVYGSLLPSVYGRFRDIDESETTPSDQA